MSADQGGRRAVFTATYTMVFPLKKVPVRMSPERRARIKAEAERMIGEELMLLIWRGSLVSTHYAIQISCNAIGEFSQPSMSTLAREWPRT